MDQPLRPRIAVPDVVHAGAIAGEHRADEQRADSPPTTPRWTITIPMPTGAAPDTGRTHIYNASLIWLLPTLEDKSRADARPLWRLGGHGDRWRRIRPAADGVHGHSTGAEWRAVRHRLQRQSAAQPRRRSGRVAPTAIRRSRSSIPRPTRWSASSWARSAPRGAAIATAPGTSRPTWRSTRTSR